MTDQQPDLLDGVIESIVRAWKGGNSVAVLYSPEGFTSLHERCLAYLEHGGCFRLGSPPVSFVPINKTGDLVRLNPDYVAVDPYLSHAEGEDLIHPDHFRSAPELGDAIRQALSSAKAAPVKRAESGTASSIHDISEASISALKH